MLDDLAKTSQGQASQRMASATESATESAMGVSICSGLNRHHARTI